MTNATASPHEPLWRSGEPLQQHYESLRSSHHTGVLVIGAGISGLSIGLELLHRGYQVTICDSAVIGSGTTGGSSAHLDVLPDTGVVQLVKTVGLEQASDTIRLRRSAIDAIESRAAGGCEFVRIPGYSYTERKDGRDSMRSEYEALCSLGCEAHWEDAVPLPHAVCGFRVDGLARFDPLAYLHRLAALVTDAGGRIFERTPVEAPAEKHPHSLLAGEARIEFDHVVCAVHSNYTGKLAQRVYVQTPPHQSYVLAARVADPPPDGLFWDDADPYFYTRRASSHYPNLVVIGGCDHRTGGGGELRAEAQLEQYVRERYDVQEIVCRWSAELFEPTDGLPIIGKLPAMDNVWVVTGLSGIGLTWGTVAGWLIADQILGRQTTLQSELAPSRFRISSLPNLMLQQSPVAQNYARRILPGETIDPASLKPGEGAVGRVDGQQVAICRDASGCEHRQSPICTHMGGVVQWNAAEQTWDCPVHGGRFNADGTRFYGPPEHRLEPVKQSGRKEQHGQSATTKEPAGG